MKLKNIALVVVTSLVFSTNALCNVEATKYQDESTKVTRLNHLKYELNKFDKQIKGEYESYEKLKNINPEKAKKCELKMYELFVEYSKIEDEINDLDKLHKKL